MRRILITFLCVLMPAMAWQRAWGFALLGPLTPLGGDSWETPSIGYALGGDVGTPKNIGQGYRRNLPVMYYAYDPSFASTVESGGYFGLQGEEAIDQAFAILNNAFTNNSSLGLDGYSAGLTEFPFDSQIVNDTAEQLGLTDLKSEMLDLMMEQLGLAQPERYVWTLHDRYLPSGGKCPLDELYLVVQRNYGIVPSPLTAVQYSSYINNTLYTYEIEEFCSPPVPPDAVTAPIAEDPYANNYTAVAGLGQGLGLPTITTNQFGEAEWAATEAGGVYNGLSVDDVGGLRYLMSTNNVVWEDISGGSLLEDTNTTQLLLLQTANLYTLMQFAQTNPPAAVEAEFPGIVVNQPSTYYTLVTNWNVYSYFTNYPGSAAGAPPVFVIGTNGFTLSAQTNYVYTFANVVYVHYYTNTPAQQVTISLSEKPGSPYEAPLIETNVTTKKIILTNVISGDYYLLPPGSCGYEIVSTLVSNYFAGTVTNIITMATNTASTNSTLTGFVGSESILTRFTNNWYEYYACNFTNPVPGYYRGIGRIQFVRIPDTDIDPTTGTLLVPYTNTYQMAFFNPNNNQIGTQVFQRILTQPDILISAADLASPNAPQIGAYISSRNLDFDTANIIPGLDGPGTIIPPTTITFDAVGDLYGNGSLAENYLDTNGFLSQQTQAGLLQWASFDGTTNPPTLYPNGTSIQELENQLVISVSPTTLPNGTNNFAYPTIQFTVTGGQPNYTWSLDGTQLPGGLQFFNGVLSGTPVGNQPGIYDFTIEVTDQTGRSVTLNYSITIQ